MNSPWLQLLIPAVVILLPALIRVMKSFQEQAEKQQRRREAAQQRDDAIRTGRGASPQAVAASAPAAAPSPQAPARTLSLEERAARRRAELAAVRERAQAQSRAQGQPIPPPLQILLGLPGTSGPTVPTRPPGRAPGGRPGRPAAGQQPLPVPTRPAPQRVPRRGARVPPVPTRPPPASRGTSVRREDFAIEEEAAPSRLASLRAGESAARESRLARHAAEHAASIAGPRPRPVSAADWRQAILLSEVLAPPLGLRPPESA